MSEDIHKEDEYFRRAYQDSREHPSPDLRKKLLAQISGNNISYKRQKPVYGKRITFILLLLLSSVGIYRILNTNESHPISRTVYKNNHKPYKDDLSLINRRSENSSTTQPKPANQQAKTFFSTDKNQAVILNESKANYNRNYYHNLHAQASVNGKKPDAKQVQNSSISFQKAIDNPVLQLDTKLIGDYRKQMSLLIPFKKRLKTDSGNVKKKNIEAAIVLSTLRGDSANIVAGQQRLIKGKNNLSPTSVVSHIASHSKTRRSWELTPFTSLDFIQYYLDNDNTFNGNLQEDKHDIAEKERHELSFSAGLLARWQFAKKLAFKTGAIYSNVIIGIQPQTLYATTDANQITSYKLVTSSGYAYVKPVFGSSPAAGDSITSDHSLHHLHYVSLPLMLSYPLLNTKRISLLTSTGINTSFLLSTKIETDVNDNTNKEALVINKLIGLLPLYFSFMADLELQYHINRHISITFNPMMKYAVTSATKNYVVKAFPYSVSAGTGISYKF